VTHQPSGLMVISPEVQRALTRAEPVVGLESSLIAHSLPASVAPEVARECAQRVRAGGAVPATIAVIDGRIHVGIDDEQIDRLAHEPDVRKVGPRDLGSVVVSRMCGATTVAGTIAVCRVVGIHFMSTAGIGGAHRGWATSGDISADILELGTSPVCVVCSGARSFLDTAATLELLETYGIPVVGYGIDEFPLYYARSSGLELVDRAEDAATVAAVASVHWGIGRATAVLVANAIAEDEALTATELEPLIHEASAAAVTAGVSGIDLTPYVLGHLHSATAGRTLAAHRRLVGDNAELAAEIAGAYYAR
jgi:pseudouridylate synthase